MKRVHGKTSAGKAGTGSPRRSPKQDRSRKTYEALLDAAEGLLKQRKWEEISTAAIVTEAGLSNGAIYGRFKSKDDLLVGLYERHDRKLKERFAKRRSDLGKRNESIDEYLDREIDTLVENIHKNRWLLREMGLLSRRKPEVVSGTVRDERRAMLGTIADDILQFKGDMDHPDPERGARLAVFFVSTILHEAILYQGPHYGTLELSDEELKASVKRLAKRFLTGG